MLKSSNADDEFLAARILLICSIHTPLDLLPCLEGSHLAESINANISRHSKDYAPSFESASACNSNLSLLSVLAAQHKSQAYRFLGSLDPILKILNKVSIPSPPLEPPMSILIDCLASLPLHEVPHANDEDIWLLFNDIKLVEVLDLAVQSYSHEDLETRILPLVWLLSFIAPSVPPEAKKRLKARLLASDQDRTAALGMGDSLPHRLVRISMETVTPQLKYSWASLFLNLSGGDPRQLIHNVGFGCGSGLLFSLGTPVDVDKETRSNSDNNFITGQRRDMEVQSSLPDMTEEEKEPEAERLFVLFERLRRTGVVSVENPVSAARIQEVEDNTDEDSTR